MARDVRTMEIWQLAYNLVMDVYPLLESFPESESNNLSGHLRRTVMSLPINIAKGAGSGSDKVFLASLGYAHKSAKELDVLLLLSRDLGYIENDVYDFSQKKLEEFTAKLAELLRAGKMAVRD
jgi:four helix bundle protein